MRTCLKLNHFAFRTLKKNYICKRYPHVFNSLLLTVARCVRIFALEDIFYLPNSIYKEFLNLKWCGQFQSCVSRYLKFCRKILHCDYHWLCKQIGRFNILVVISNLNVIIVGQSIINVHTGSYVRWCILLN